ncbi:hypothetical protein FORC81_p394 (plasmid) [Escherichia coli]|nr:hypothetical protein FORC81_p394 [Escherichia coli]
MTLSPYMNLSRLFKTFHTLAGSLTTTGIDPTPCTSLPEFWFPSL